MRGALGGLVALSCAQLSSDASGAGAGWQGGPTLEGPQGSAATGSDASFDASLSAAAAAAAAPHR